jgi:predicted mannosyl-3-phosphoglycerate phosphatase (HAD superfamily)
MAQPLDRAEGAIPSDSSRVVLFSDVDETFLFADDGEEVRRRAIIVAGKFSRVVFASSRTAIQMHRFLRRLDHPGDFIAENGAVMVVRNPDLAEAIGRCTLWETDGGRCFYRQLGLSRFDLLDTIRQITNDAPFSRLLSSLNSRTTSGFLGARTASLLIPASLAEAPEVAGPLAQLRARGLQVAGGGRWVTIWDGPDKGETAARYLQALAAVTGVRPLVAAVGNADNDEPLLRVADLAWAMPDESGNYSASLRAVPGVRLCPERDCRGWTSLVAQLSRISEDQWRRPTAGQSQF